MNRPVSQDLKQLAKNHLLNEEFKEAREVLMQACMVCQEDAEVWYLLGRLESRADRYLSALQYYEKSLNINSRSATVYFYQALAQIETSQLRKAAGSLEKCLVVHAAYPGAQDQICVVYEQLGQLDKAVYYTERLLQKEPRNIAALNRLARLKILLGELEEASVYYNSVLVLDKSDVQAVAGLAELYIKAGDIEKATTLLEPFLDKRPMPNALAFLFSDICQFTGRCEEAVEIIEDILRRSTQPRASHRRLIYALAKLYDRLQRFDNAFKYIKEANKLKQAEAGPPELVNEADKLVRVWSREFDSKLSFSACKADSVEPVFIVGMPRSGTSLTEQILASHPEIYGAGELSDFDRIRRKYFSGYGPAGVYPECLKNASNSAIDEARKEYLDVITSLADDGCRLVTDKMPENFWNLGLIRLIFPDSRIIHCVRNPLDTCISCYFADFREGHEYSCDLSSLGAYYRQYQKIMYHWKHVIKIPVLEVCYEALAVAPEVTSRLLVEYCGLEWDRKCLSPHKTRRNVNTASFAQVRHKIYTSSVERWKNFDKYIDELKRSLGV